MVTFTQIGSIAQRDMARSTFKLFKPFKEFNWFKHSNEGFARPVASDHGATSTLRRIGCVDLLFDFNLNQKR
jgi:hypothetical protein